MSLNFGRPYHGETTTEVARRMIELLNQNGLTYREIVEVLDIVKYQLDSATFELKPTLKFFVVQK